MVTNSNLNNLGPVYKKKSCPCWKGYWLHPEPSFAGKHLEFSLESDMEYGVRHFRREEIWDVKGAGHSNPY